MAEHPSPDDLADAAEGLLDPGRAARVEEHLAGCAACQQTAAALASVTATLAAVPAPTMPTPVAARLARVLAEESARRTAAAAARPVLPPHPHVTLGHFRPARTRPPLWRRWVPVLAAAALATAIGFGGYVLSATAGLNEPPVVAVALSSRDLAAQATTLEDQRDLDPHRFSNAWFCARSVTRGRITGLAGASVDGRPALLVYTSTGGAESVTVVTGCGGIQPSAIASAPLPR